MRTYPIRLDHHRRGMLTMKGLTQFSIPANESGPVLTYRGEPFTCPNATGRDIPADHFVAVKAERGEWVIVADLGERR